MNNTPRARLEAAAQEARSSLRALAARPWREQTRPGAGSLTERPVGHWRDESSRPALAGAAATALVVAMGGAR